MPFVNESGDVDLDYLSDGMTDTLIGSLSRASKSDCESSFDRVPVLRATDGSRKPSVKNSTLKAVS